MISVFTVAGDRRGWREFGSACAAKWGMLVGNFAFMDSSLKRRGSFKTRGC